MENSVGQLNVVTGAFGFSGKYIAHRLLASGERVRTTNHAGTSSLFEVAPLDFRRPQELVDNMAGATVLYNTYWVRFAYGEVSHEKAVENTSVLIRAAQQAGISRIVHVSITNPSSDSPLLTSKAKRRWRRRSGRPLFRMQFSDRLWFSGKRIF